MSCASERYKRRAGNRSRARGGAGGRRAGRGLRALLLIGALVVVGGATTQPAPPASVIREAPAVGPRAGVVAVYEGKGSWYGRERQGHLTASGERFNMRELTAAHRTLRMNTRV